MWSTHRYETKESRVPVLAAYHAYTTKSACPTVEMVVRKQMRIHGRATSCLHPRVPARVVRMVQARLASRLLLSRSKRLSQLLHPLLFMSK
jgi:hypothetical protein